LFFASHKGHLAVVRELLARGANIEAASNNGATCLFLASEKGQLDIVCELLARGANVNAATDVGTTPLIHASRCGRVEVVRALLAAGADKRKRLMFHNVHTATSLAGKDATAPPGSRAAILALLAAAP
jgi:ankyrin repeat protein